MGDTLTTISPRDVRGQKQVDALLEQEGIRRDGNLDYTCGLFDSSWRLAATGSCFGNTIRCLAVDRDRQGEGLLNQIVSHLMEVQTQRGNTHLFLYTKPQSARFFGDLGFYEIVQAEGVVFMENRRRGFSDYCAALERTRREGTSAAIVMNANPFTLGHLHLVERAAAENNAVHLFVLSEEAGPIPFAVRRRLVREGTAHLSNVICHDSGPYIISGATFPSYFLKDGDTVIRAHAALDLAVFGRIAPCLNLTRRYVGEERTSHVTALYNEEMIRRLPELGIECRVVPRLERDGQPVSASTVRQAIHDGRLEDIRPLVPDAAWDYFTSPEAGAVIAAIQAEQNVIHY
ncbi:MAG: [citrate (pro-3S)-lyase] ligase [Lawsonibacter sp.]|nr:[citrate (pro-3S)-lyase] ligase [Lawsonibacter sp.]MCI8990753.1 [citrate (pro-3S)-lyase] ligase [Lawsonibacter sp.]